MSEMMTEPYADVRVYELGFHVLPTVGESGSHDVMNELADMVKGSGAEVLTSETPEFIELAYPMLKIIDNKRSFFETAYFGWVKFALTADKVAEIEKEVKSRKDILRFILIKTIAEDVALMTESDARGDRNDRNNREEKKASTQTQVTEATSDDGEDASESPKKEAAPKSDGKPDDFKKIEGIGPKIAETITAAGVTTFAQLADQAPEAIAEMITEVRGSHDPASWPLQAAMARDGQWDELKAWQDEHDGGKIT